MSLEIAVDSTLGTPRNLKRQISLGLGETVLTRALLTAVAATFAIAAQADTIKVGVVQGLSGPAAVVDFGESYLQGIKAAVDDYKAAGGKHQIELIVYDDEANPQRAVSMVQRLITNDKVPLVIGTVNSGNVLAFAPILQRAGIPLLAGPSVATNITAQFIDENPSFIFRCSMVEKFQVDAILDWGVKTFKKIGIVHSTSGYGNFALQEVKEGLKARGVELAAIEAAAPTVTDLTPQMLNLKNAGVELALNFHEQFELMFRVMAKLNYRPTVAGNWGISSLKVLEIVGVDLIEGAVMGQALDLGLPKVKAFDERMRKLYGGQYRWPVVVALGYDGARIALMAVDKAGGDPKKIRDELERIDGYEAISGTPPKPFGPKDHECLDRKDVFLGVWRKGEVVRLQ